MGILPTEALHKFFHGMTWIIENGFGLFRGHDASDMMKDERIDSEDECVSFVPRMLNNETWMKRVSWIF
jgi:hypothetical protein